MNPDGSFLARGVPAGRYRLTINLRGSPRRVGVHTYGGQLVGSLSHDFEVTGTATQSSSLDLGELELVLLSTLKIGDLAPLFSAQSFDGEEIKLEDFRGKYILLDFWATWCGPCVKDIPNLKAVHSSFGQNQRFAMISLSLDDDLDSPKRFVKKNEIEWLQGLLGDSKTPITRAYGVQGIPSVFLIDPKGKVIARDLHGPSTVIIVRKALGGV